MRLSGSRSFRRALTWARSGGAWRQPQLYASFLAIELKYDYPGRLLVVMPNGFGVAWTADKTAGIKLAEQLDRSPEFDMPAGYVLATTTAVRRIEAAAGVSAAELTQTAAAIKAANAEKARVRRRPRRLYFDASLPASCLDVLVS